MLQGSADTPVGRFDRHLRPWWPLLSCRELRSSFPLVAPKEAGGRAMSSNDPEPLVCPECRAIFRTRKTIRIGDGAALKCPRCGHLSTVGNFRKLNRSPESGRTPGAAMPPVQNADSDPLPPDFDNLDIESPPHQFARSRRSRRRLLGAIDFFDFGFKRYLTLVILKITWMLAVVVFLGIVFTAVLDSAGAITTDIFGEFTAGAQDAGLPWFNLDDYPEPTGGNGGGSMLESETAESIKRTFARAVGYVVALGVQIGSSVMLLLWVRVLLEGTVVIFQVANDVKAIRDATKQAR